MKREFAVSLDGEKVVVCMTYIWIELVLQTANILELYRTEIRISIMEIFMRQYRIVLSIQCRLGANFELAIS